MNKTYKAVDFGHSKGVFVQEGAAAVSGRVLRVERPR